MRSGQLQDLKDPVDVSPGDLIGEAGRKVKAGAQIVDRGDINDPVSNVDDIGNMDRP